MRTLNTDEAPSPQCAREIKCQQKSIHSHPCPSTSRSSPTLPKQQIQQILSDDRKILVSTLEWAKPIVFAWVSQKQTPWQHFKCESGGHRKYYLRYVTGKQERAEMDSNEGVMASELPLGVTSISSHGEAGKHMKHTFPGHPTEEHRVGTLSQNIHQPLADNCSLEGWIPGYSGFTTFFLRVFILLVARHLTSPTRDRTHTPCIGSMES